MWSLPALLLTAHLLTRNIERRRVRHAGPADVPAVVSHWEIVRRSRYIKIFVAGLALSVIVSTLVDFQFKYYIQRIHTDDHGLAQYLGKFYVALKAAALLFTFGAKGWLKQRIRFAA